MCLFTYVKLYENENKFRVNEWCFNLWNECYMSWEIVWKPTAEEYVKKSVLLWKNVIYCTINLSISVHKMTYVKDDV